MINESFKSWNDNPIKTTIDTRPIKEMTLPKVTVCPPKNTYTDLNYDLMRLENKTLDNDTRDELFYNAVNIIYDHFCETNNILAHSNDPSEHCTDYFYNTVMRNISRLVDNDRYYNWYHGYTRIDSPYFDSDSGTNLIVHTSAAYGSIATQHFHENSSIDMIENFASYHVYIYPPDSAKKEQNVTLHFEIEYRKVEKLSNDDRDMLFIGDGKSYELLGKTFTIEKTE